ncbi:hypothetical protein EQ827_03040 [Lactobacillus bombi]|nr:hypothetical protein [Bombilactobacillus bombi]
MLQLENIFEIIFLTGRQLCNLFYKVDSLIIRCCWCGRNLFRGSLAMSRTQRFDWLSLIIGIFSVVVGVQILRNPVSGLISIMILLGAFSLVRGCYQLWLAAKIHQIMMRSRVGWLIFSGVIDIILGLVFLFNFPLGLTTLIYILAFWFIIDGVAELSLAPIYRRVGKSYHWLIIILAILSIVAGITLLFRPLIGGVLIVSLAAVYFFMAGILEIIEAF